MNFTREPIIETIISPKEGYKIVVRNTKVAGQEEYFVDAVEVVSFGSAIFFRSLERPKPFLVPVTDYEILEVRETRMVLKNVVSSDKSIKIGGGKDNKPPVQKTMPQQKKPEETKEAETEKKPSKRRTVRRRRAPNKEVVESETQVNTDATTSSKQEGTKLESPPVAQSDSEVVSETNVSSSVLSLLFPPPTTLISQKISKNKNTAFSESEANVEVKEETVETSSSNKEPEQEENLELVKASSTVFTESAEDASSTEKEEEMSPSKSSDE